jgi:hypothetical protein
LTTNNYPKKLIDKIIKKFKFHDTKPKANKVSNNNNNNNNSEKTKYACLPYIPNFTKNLAIKLKNVNNNINFAYKPCQRLSQIAFTNTKAKIAKSSKAGVVYKLKCLGNSQEECDKVYVGETSKKLETRITKHKYDINSNKKVPKSSGCTALIKHINETRHNFDTQNPIILKSNYTNTYKRRFMESTQIQSIKPYTVNYKVDTEQLGTTYCNIINKYRAKQNKQREKYNNKFAHS